MENKKIEDFLQNYRNSYPIDNCIELYKFDDDSRKKY